MFRFQMCHRSNCFIKALIQTAWIIPLQNAFLIRIVYAANYIT